MIGGIEASLRRVTHYDYWSDKLQAGIIKESGADLLVYGMGEQPLQEIVSLLKKGVPFSSLTTIKQTAYIKDQEAPLKKNKNWTDVELASHESCLAIKRLMPPTSKLSSKSQIKQKETVFAGCRGSNYCH